MKKNFNSGYYIPTAAHYHSTLRRLLMYCDTTGYVCFVISWLQLAQRTHQSNAFRYKYNLMWLHSDAKDSINKLTPCL